MSGQMTGNGDQHADFRARLERMGHGAAPAAEPVTQATAPKPRPRPDQPVKLNDWRENIRYPLAFVGAFFIGVLSYCVARYVSFHISGGDAYATGDDVTMPAGGGAMFYLEMAMAFAASFVLKNALRLDGKEWAFSQTVGIVGMSAIFHNFVYLAPGLFAGIFSPEWVEFEMWMNEFGTAAFMGYVVAF